MNKVNKTIHVQGKNIGVMRVGTEDYICLTDMVRGELESGGAQYVEELIAAEQRRLG